MNHDIHMSHVWLPLHAHFQDALHVVLHGAPIVEDYVVLLGVFNARVGKDRHLGVIERNNLPDLNPSGDL